MAAPALPATAPPGVAAAITSCDVTPIADAVRAMAYQPDTAVLVAAIGVLGTLVAAAIGAAVQWKTLVRTLDAERARTNEALERTAALEQHHARLTAARDTLADLLAATDPERDEPAPAETIVALTHRVALLLDDRDADEKRLRQAIMGLSIACSKMVGPATLGDVFAAQGDVYEAARPVFGGRR